MPGHAIGYQAEGNWQLLGCLHGDESQLAVGPHRFARFCKTILSLDFRPVFPDQIGDSENGRAFIRRPRP